MRIGSTAKRLALTLGWLPAACGPTMTPTPVGGGATSGAMAPASSDGAGASATLMLDGADSSTGDAEDDVLYDLPPQPEPEGACGLPLPAACDPTWPDQEAALTGVAGSMFGNVGGELEVSLSSLSGSPDPDVAWTLEFTMPCPTMPGAPVPGQERFVVDGEVTIAVPAKFEFTVVGTYAATVDVEFINACAHLQLHAIEVDPVGEPAEARPYSWPSLPPVGFVHVTSVGGG